MDRGGGGRGHLRQAPGVSRGRVGAVVGHGAAGKVFGTRVDAPAFPPQGGAGQGGEGLAQRPIPYLAHGQSLELRDEDSGCHP